MKQSFRLGIQALLVFSCLSFLGGTGALVADDAPAKVLATVAGELKKLDDRRRELIKQALAASINNKLLEAEAAKQGISVPELVAKEIDPKVAAPTDADVDAFYESRKAQMGNRPKEQVAGQIREYLKRQRQAEVGEAYLATLRGKYEIKDFLAAEHTAAEAAQAEEARRALARADGPSAGPAGAPVTIVEFSDFQCPFCSRLVPTIEQVKKNFADKVRVVFMQFPIPQLHRDASKAAEASLCAHDQGKFWEMHDAMFADQRNLAVPALKEKAAQLGLDAQVFGQCLDSGKHQPKVAADVAAGKSLGVTGTPMTFINGRPVSGAAPYEQLVAIINDELARASGK